MATNPTISKWCQQIGQKGGKSTSVAKARASRHNGCQHRFSNIDRWLTIRRREAGQPPGAPIESYLSGYQLSILAAAKVRLGVK